jgi:ribonuclease HI
MSKSKAKFYVVWKGRKTGVFPTWESCKEQIFGFQGALYKGFATRQDAEQAFRSGHQGYMATSSNSSSTKQKGLIGKSAIIKPSISVDAACSGNPGLMEYQGVDTENGTVFFHQGPYKNGTNNIGEFLAIVHALALLKKKNHPKLPIYTDSKTAISWVKKKKCNTKLEEITGNEELFEMIDRAENWLKMNTWENPILKWETSSWGEIPADFGRK